MKEIIYIAWNPLTKKFEHVDPESEIAPDAMVIPLFWVESIQRYVTVPGTEAYGHIPEERREIGRTEV